MQVAPLFQAGSASSAGDAARNNEIAGDFDQFLTLLTTQLQNQDPMSPMDSTEFTNQLVGFSEVEQSVKTNDQIGQLIELQSSSEAAMAGDLVGRRVDVLDDRLTRAADGSADGFYVLGDNAASVTVNVVDSFGRPVRSLPGSGNSGFNTVSWDGRDTNGVLASAGSTYTLQVIPRDAGGNILPVSIGSTATVTGAHGPSDDVSLTLDNGRAVGIGTILGMRAG